MKDYYRILNLPPSANLAEIKSAYRKLAHQYHPDKNAGDPYAAAQFEAIKEAYEVLSNPSRKEYYLQQRWYDQSTGRKRTEDIVTPETVLRQALELDKHVSTLDFHRMDTEGLYNYICSLLTDDTITRLNTFNETDIIDTIVLSIIKSSRPLPFQYVQLLAARLEMLNSSGPAKARIAQLVRQSRQSATWNRYRVFVLLLVVIVLCIIIYIISN